MIHKRRVRDNCDVFKSKFQGGNQIMWSLRSDSVERFSGALLGAKMGLAEEDATPLVGAGLSHVIVMQW